MNHIYLCLLLIFIGYIAICSFFNLIKPDRHIFTWFEGVFAQLFTKLSVNTIGRSDNIDDLLLENIDWENDALTILFSNTKSDIEGETTNEKKRLYANPFMPTTCVILGLAIYTWCKFRNAGDKHLFDGGDQNKRYYKNLLHALEKIPAHIDVGCKRRDIGTHSNRKFAESTSASKVDGPSRTQVCLRAGQSVGRTQDCYIFAEEDGDSLVGRTVAQLKFDADQFDVLPAHFSNETLAELDQYGWCNILHWYNNFPESYQRVIPKLFASIVYHHFEGDLANTIDAEHPLYSQPIFTDRRLIESLRNKVILCHSYCADTHMSAQGVPGFITISREIRNFRRHYDETRRQNENQYALLSNEIKQLMDSMPDRVVTLLLEKVNVEGAQPVTLESIRNLFQQLLTAEGGPFAEMSRNIQEIQRNMLDGTIASRSTEIVPTEQVNSAGTPATGRFHYWIGVDDRTHRVPLGFTWPKGKNTRVMWDHWFLVT